LPLLSQGQRFYPALAGRSEGKLPGGCTPVQTTVREQLTLTVHACMIEHR